MEFPSDRYYTPQDEWLLVDGDEALIGITAYAQDQLGDIVFVEMPDPGRTFTAGSAFGVVESVKAVSDLYLPASGEVIARNERLYDEPELVNHAPYDEGWIIRIRLSDASELDRLLDAATYSSRIPTE